MLAYLLGYGSSQNINARSVLLFCEFCYFVCGLAVLWKLLPSPTEAVADPTGYSQQEQCLKMCFLHILEIKKNIFLGTLFSLSHGNHFWLILSLLFSQRKNGRFLFLFCMVCKNFKKNLVFGCSQQ